MSDTSTTASCILSFGKLLDRVERTLDPADVLELVNRNRQALAQPRRRVGPALVPKGRGGVSEKQRRKIAERDDAMRELARLCFADLRPEQQARELRLKLERFAATRWWADVPGAGEERMLQQQVLQISDGHIPKQSQTKQILKADVSGKIRQSKKPF